MGIRILAFSDIHGDRALIARLKDTLNASRSGIDIAVCCGDITPVHGSTIDAARMIGNLGVRTLIVPGNFEMPNDLRTACKELNWTDLHGKYIEFKGYVFAGCGGGNVSPFSTPYELGEDQFSELLGRLRGINRDGRLVLLTHCPPYGVVDEPRQGMHVGSSAIAGYVMEERPMMHFCGHIHEQGGREGTLGGTRVVNTARNIMLVELP
ncbi:MAG: metallophosphoesterase [Candidatus Nitrosocaldus sp.]|nr:metallophosphoesterase [Candidatus Nitrosocaldus sp.]MDW8276340.1 metallophosphoesterase [Candidatus Nitrosocaldus sp.]